MFLEMIQFGFEHIHRGILASFILGVRKISDTGGEHQALKNLCGHIYFEVLIQKVFAISVGYLIYLVKHRQT